jgi:hypothetical protein
MLAMRKKASPCTSAFWLQRVSRLSLVQHNDSFMTFLCVPVSISARGVARGGSQLIRFHARFTD